MSTVLNKITQISIYLKGSQGLEKEAEKVNEVAVFQPISKRSTFDPNSFRLKARQWTLFSKVPPLKRLFLKIKIFFFHHLHLFMSKERLTPEAKFKTVLALLLSQEELRDYFLKSKEPFFEALQKGAFAAGFDSFTLPKENLVKELTELNGKDLLEHPTELALQMATLDNQSRDAILFAILSHVERTPMTSVLQVEEESGKSVQIEMRTEYAKCKVKEIAPDGRIDFTIERNKTTSSLGKEKNLINQRLVYETENGSKRLLGGYSGELLTQRHILEQLLFLIHAESNKKYFLQENGGGKELKILFTSLFSWNEYEKILNENEAVDGLHLRTLQIEGGEKYLLKLYHQNLPFNALNKFPTPSETKAHMRDLNNEMLIAFTHETFLFLRLKSPLGELLHTCEMARKTVDYFQKQKNLHDCVDQFHKLLPELLNALPMSHEIVFALKALLTNKKLHGADALLYTEILTKHLNILHHTNCSHGADKASAANALEKGQNAYRKIHGMSFLPERATSDELALFQVLYSMYLVWEEPELNAGLSTGFVGEKYFRNFIQRNAEATRYLTPWLKHHPELYLGLSSYRY